MDWIAVFTWGLVAALGLSIAHRAVRMKVSLELQAPLALGGFALVVLFLALGGPSWAAWCAVGLGVLGFLVDAFGAAWLISGDRPTSPAGQDSEETNAALIGLQLPLYGLATLFALLAALNVATVA